MKAFFMVCMMAAVGSAQQLGSGLQLGGGMNGLQFGQNCGVGNGLSMQMPSMQQKAKPVQKTNKEDLAEIKYLNKEKSQKKKELLQAQHELQNFDSKLRSLFDSTAYDFIKEHFDSEHHCQDYKGYAEDGKNASVSFPSNKISSEWPQLCDVENNLQGQLKPSICSKNYLLRGNDSSCASVISQYPVTKHKVDNLKKEIEDIDSQVSSLKDSMKSEQDAEGADGGLGVDALAKDSSDTEGGICLECMNRGSAPGGRAAGSGSNLSSLLTNSVMAFMAYNSTNSFYSNMADKNANLGFPTTMTNTTSPFTAASPYLMNILGQTSGLGGSNCGQMGGQQMQIGSGFQMGQQTQSMPFQMNSGMQIAGGMQYGSGLQLGSGMQLGNGMSLVAGSSLQYQLLGLNQRLPYLQSPYSVNSSLYYGNTGLSSGYSGGYTSGYNSLYGR